MCIEHDILKTWDTHTLISYIIPYGVMLGVIFTTAQSTKNLLNLKVLKSEMSASMDKMLLTPCKVYEQQTSIFN